jgi:predicted DNA-binding ribbon-helix-helix protein
MSLTIPRSILIAGRKTSVRLENAFWVGLQEIADQRLMALPGLIATIDAQRQHGNRSSALRLFVLEYYRRRVADAPEASSGISVLNPPPPRAPRREGRRSRRKSSGPSGGKENSGPV